jgi:D-serine deaminase-like pyridoxal phosphate-dependent protein
MSPKSHAGAVRPTATGRTVPGVDPAEYLGLSVDALPTPCLVVDLPTLEANIDRWQRGVERHGKRLRPHIKTTKSPEIAALQVRAGACGIAVAKVAEAEVFAAHGFDDIVVAYPVYGEEKWRRLAALAASCRISVNADNADAVRGLSAAADRAGVVLQIQIDIDSGFHRGGIPTADIDAIHALAELVTTLPGLELNGITTHRGIFFDGAGAMAIDDAGRDEGRLMVEVAEALRARGISVREVTAGGTISGFGVAEIDGVTEVRAGTYVFNDLMQVGFGSAQLDDCALSIHCTVVSAQSPGQVTIDGGSKTFSGDRGLVGAAGAAAPEIARGIGRPVTLERITEEHGMVSVQGGTVRVGDRLAFTPPHACTAVNLSDELFGVRDGVVETVWPVWARGKRT